MSRRTWFVRLGALFVMVFIVALAPAATTRATRMPPPARLLTCPASAPRSPATGAWWRRLAVLDALGTIVGWQVEVGREGGRRRGLDLPAEASVSGPVRGLVVVTESDGRRSRVSLISSTGNCTQLVHETDAVVRRAVLDPTTGTMAMHVLRRADRADLGVWRVAAQADAAPSQILGPSSDVPEIAALGTIWSTELQFDESGNRLAVQSCGVDGCVTRVIDVGTGATAIVGGEFQGDLIAFAAGRLVVWAASDAVPSAIYAYDVQTGTRRLLLPDAMAAAPLAGSRWLAIATGDGPASTIRLVDVVSGEIRPAPTALIGTRILDVGLRASSAVEAADGSLPIDTAGGLPGSVNVFVEQPAEEVQP